ncbi:MAG TPA: hypothetical protein VF644_20990, partial [Pyrinomonadaceae bacterium]|jgi:hypothetical protein
MPTIEQTMQKVRNFAKLPIGWHYGEGEPIDTSFIERAEKFLSTASGWGIEEANAFPGADGQIEVTFYFGNKTFAFMFETDNTVSITEEIKGEIISDVYEQPYEAAEQKLWELSQKTQIIYDSSTLDIGTQEIIDLEARRFSVRRRTKTRFAVFQSSRLSAYWKLGEQSASTSPTSTAQLPVTQLSSCV